MAACSPGDWPRACAVPVETHHHHDHPQRLKRGFVLFSPPRPAPGRARGDRRGRARRPLTKPGPGAPADFFLQFSFVINY